jgi:hypothetical protein
VIERFMTLLEIARGRTPDPESSTARTLQLAAAALLMALGFGAIWGLAAGSSSWVQAMSNLWKVPMVLLFSALAAIPGGLLTWKLAGGPGRASDLLVQFAAAIFAGTLAMAVLSPLVALYYHSSSFAGPLLALASSGLALLVAVSVFVRGAFKSVATNRQALILPVFAFVALHLGALLQLIVLASPILPEVTVFDAGVDGLVSP